MIPTTNSPPKMAVKVYGMTMSTCTKRVLTTCHELGVKYEIITVDLLKGEHKNPDWITTKQPFGAIPVLIDEDGTQVFESRAIARYLVNKYGSTSGLAPPTSDFKAHGLFEQAASIEYSIFDPAASGVYLENLHSRLEGREPNQDSIAKFKQTLLLKFEGYERILSKQSYLAGETFTLADLFHIPYGKALEQYEPGIFHSQPSVKRWWETITSRESWKAVAALDGLA